MFATNAQANVSLDFSSLGSSRISFDPVSSSIQFTPDVNGFDFSISNASLPQLDGLEGNIQGTFSLGAVNNPGGGVETASVTGMGTLSIYDGVSSYFTAKVWWNNAATFGTIGGLNTQGKSNVSNFSYSGDNAALQALAASTAGTDVVSFQFAAPESLDALASGDTATTTTYSGSLTAIPESSTAACALGAMALAGGLFRRRKQAV